MKYSGAIKKLRLKMCLTQTEFVVLFNVDSATINRWETNSHEPIMKLKRILKEYFGKENINIEAE